MSETAYCRPAAAKQFQQHLLSIDTSDGLFGAAFAIALHECPEASLSEVETIVENLADTIDHRVRSRSTEAILAHLHDVLFEVFGLHGNVEDYYSPANSYLPDVLRTRQGLPIVLVLIYKRIAERLGLTVYGVNSPGHFLAEVEPESPSTEPLYIDPFFRGSLLKQQEVAQRISASTGLQVEPSPKLLARASHRQWLSRMLNNLQAAFAALGQDRDVCAMQELQAML